MWRTKSIDAILATAERHRLHRSLGPVQLTLFGVGSVIGTGIFVLTAEAAQRAGPAMMVAFIIAGFVCAAAGLCYAELSAMVPVAGSAYTYTYAVLGELVAWMVGWALILEYAVAASAVAVGWSAYVTGILQHGLGVTLPPMITEGPYAGGIINLPAVAVSLLVTTLLVLGTRESAKVNAVLVVLKIGALIAFVALAGPVVNEANFHPFAPLGGAGVGAAAASIFFAYVGFDAVSTAAEETRNPQVNVPIGLLGSLAICTLFYLLVAGAAAGAYGAQPVFGDHHTILAPGSYALAARCAILTNSGPGPLACSNEALAFVLRQIGHPKVGNLLGLAAGIALPSVILMTIYGQTRIFFAMSRDGLLPARLASIHPRFKTPHVVTLLTGVGVALTAAFLPVGQLADIANSGTLFAFLIVALAVLMLRRTAPDRLRPFRTPAIWLIAPFAMAGCVGLFIFLPTPAKLVFPIWSAIGLIFYAAYGRRHSLVGQAHPNLDTEGLTLPITTSTPEPRMKGPVVLTLGLLALCLASIPDRAIAADTSPRQARLDAAFTAIHAALAKSHAPGAIVAITDRQRLLDISAYGYADVKARIPLRTDARFPLGSISKSFTAISLMQLSDEGRFDPAKPLSDYLPAFKLAGGARPLTGREILSHTSGLPNYRAELASSPAVLGALSLYTPTAKPGAYWYSNLGFQILGYALEQLDHAPYRTIIARRLFTPLGMNRSAALIDDSQRDQVPVSYTRGADGIYREATWFEYAAADSSIIASAADLSAYVRMLLNRGVGPKGRLLSEAAFTAMTTPVAENYGYGLRLKSDSSGAIVWHGGAVMGFLNLFEAHLDAGYGVIILTNGGLEPTLEDWIRAALEAAWTGAPIPPAPPAVPAPPPPSAFVGTYHAAGGRTLTLAMHGPALVAKTGEQTLVLQRAGADTFTPPTDSGIGYPLIFEMKDNAPAGVSIGADWYALGTSSPAPTPDSFRPLVGHYQNRSPEGPVIRIFVRNGALMIRLEGEVHADDNLQPLKDGSYGLSMAPDSPERLRFGTTIDGHAASIDLSGSPLYRIDTP